MAVGDLYLGLAGSEILLHRAGYAFRESDTEISVEARAADGTLLSDLTAVKKHFEVPYTFIEDDDLTAILALYALSSELNFKITRKDLSVDQYTVMLRPMARKRELVRDIILWSELVIVLDEV